MRIHWLQHVPFEGLGTIKDWASSRGHETSSTRLHAGEDLPDLASFDWLVVMGGPMGACDTDTHPWLAGETAFIAEAVQADRLVLGVCLGAQLIASALGASVGRNPEPEIGWFPVRTTREAAASRVFEGLPPEFEAFHWHGDTFQIPAGALRTASSEACPNQAFEAADGRVVGLQFHLEVTRPHIARLAREVADDLVDAPWVQPLGELVAPDARFRSLEPRLFGVLDRMAARG